MDNNGINSSLNDSFIKKNKRLEKLGIGSFLYALLYIVCLYHNASGITYPFFACGTVWFIGYFIKKLDNGENNQKEHINKKFLMISIIAAGALNCTTDSGILIFFNKMLMFVLICILLLQCWYDLSGWSITSYIKAFTATFFGSIFNILTPIGDILAKRQLKRANNNMHGENSEDKANSSTGKKRIFVSVAIGLVIAMPVALFIGILLASADAVFYRLMCDIFTFSFDIDLNVVDFIVEIIKVLFRMFIVFGVCYGIYAYNSEPRNIQYINNFAVKSEANIDTYIAITVNGVMCVIYLLFSVIQIFGLFLGKMRLPEGYTYASYARHGFFELVFVCLFNIFLVLFTLAYFENSKILKLLLTVICACTYIMTISSAYRMILYIVSYQLTFLRVFVLWGLVIIAFVMSGVLIYIHNTKFAFCRYTLTVITIGWLVFSALHPDYWIASYNINAVSEGQEYDSYYLRRRLSLDAAPALTEELLNSKDSSYYRRASQYESQMEGFLGGRRFNLSKEYAVYKIGIKG